MHFSVRALGPFTEVMTFDLMLDSAPYGTRGETEIRSFTTSQAKVGFIPAGRKSLEGYKGYRKYFDRLTRALWTEDPATQSGFQEVA